MNSFLAPFLMFEGQAEEAATLYVSLIPDSAILALERWRAGEPGTEGRVKLARLKLGDLEVKCSDSPVAHKFTFTPSMSMFLQCRSEAEFERLAAALSAGGAFLMPPGDYGFSRKFAWANDRFGVSWQLNLA